MEQINGKGNNWAHINSLIFIFRILFLPKHFFPLLLLSLLILKIHCIHCVQLCLLIVIWDSNWPPIAVCNRKYVLKISIFTWVPALNFYMMRYFTWDLWKELIKCKWKFLAGCGKNWMTWKWRNQKSHFIANLSKLWRWFKSDFRQSLMAMAFFSEATLIKSLNHFLQSNPSPLKNGILSLEHIWKKERRKCNLNPVID